MYLYELRNLWQLFFHVTVGAFVTLQIWLRQAQGKAPDYDVWHPLQTYCLGFGGQEEGGLLNCHCDGEPAFPRIKKLCFPSLQLHFLFQVSMACPWAYNTCWANSSQKNVGHEMIIWGRRRRLICGAVTVQAWSDASGTLASVPALDPCWRVQSTHTSVFCGPSRNSTAWVCLREALV